MTIFFFSAAFDVIDAPFDVAFVTAFDVIGRHLHVSVGVEMRQVKTPMLGDLR